MNENQVARTTHLSNHYSRQNRVLTAVVLACTILAVYSALAPTLTVPLANVADDSPSAVSTPREGTRGADDQGHGISSDLPKAEVLAEITHRAVRDALHVHRGFMPSVTAVTDCYQVMPRDDLEQRIFCIQLDGAAWAFEKMAPPAWRAKDEAANDYFTDSRFRERQLNYALPISDAPEFIPQKQRFLSVLREVLSSAIREELEKGMPAESKNAPSQVL
jgi:hypothetical protein